MKEGGVVFILATVCIIFGHGKNLGLSLTKDCGEITCFLYQYCSDHICQNCSKTCSEGNNFDQVTCETNCQDYIHDEVRRYMTKAESLKITKDLQEKIENLRKMVATSSTLDLQETIENLRKMVATSTTLAILSFMGLLLVVGFSSWKKCKGRHPPFTASEKKLTVATICNNNERDPPNLPAQSQVSYIGAPSVVTTTTPLSTRPKIPSEDATLEHGYDNHALTPSPEQTIRNETIF